MKFYVLGILITLMILNSCNQKEQVDLVVINGSVFIVDEQFSKAESFAVSNGKIIAIGTNRDVQNKYNGHQTYDAKGKFIYPGFNDAHCHFNGYAINLIEYADLRGTESPEEIYDILQTHHKKFGGEWVLGRSWDQNDWKEKQFPDKTELDKLFPDTPVFLVRVDGHAGWCNSKALEMACITSDTKVDGGEVVLKNGAPGGILIDNAMGLVSRLIPKISEEQQRKGLLEAQRNCFAAGLTSLTDCGLSKEAILRMDKMQQEGSLKMRVNAMLDPTEENFDYFVRKGAWHKERLVVNTIKIYADGALGSRGALLFHDYSDDPGNSGLQMANQNYYDKICQLAFDHNFVVATHAIGDSANRLVLNTYGKFLKGKNDRRWRIEHAQIINADDFSKFAQFSIVPSIQATHCTSDMYWAEDRLGPERIKGAYAYQTLLKQLGWLPNGTDFPVENIEPLFTFYAAVFRTDHKGWPEGGWHKNEGLSREQALRSMTIWAAKSSFRENRKGSLEPGKWADFVILDTDLMKASPKEVLNAKILSTWVAGEKVFEL